MKTVIATLVMVFGLLLYGFKSGKTKEQRDNFKELIEQTRKAHEIEESVAAMDIDDIRDGMRKYTK